MFTFEFVCLKLSYFADAVFKCLLLLPITERLRIIKEVCTTVFQSRLPIKSPNHKVVTNHTRFLNDWQRKGIPHYAY